MQILTSLLIAIGAVTLFFGVVFSVAWVAVTLSDTESRVKHIEEMLRKKDR